MTSWGMKKINKPHKRGGMVNEGKTILMINNDCCMKDIYNSGETPQYKRPFLAKEWSFLFSHNIMSISCIKEATNIDNGEYIAINKHKMVCKYSRYDKLGYVNCSLFSELFFKVNTQINKNTQQENV